MLEPKAINLALLTFHKMFFLKKAHFQVNNATTLPYLMKMRWTGSREMTALAKEIWKFCLSLKIIINAEYLPGKLKFRADCWSRSFQDSSEYLLSTKVFQMISRKRWSSTPPELVINFTIAWNQILTVRQHALQQKRKTPGASIGFPPFSLIGRVLSKVKKGGITMILVTPNWSPQPWYSQILDPCITESLLLPQSQEL